MPTIMGDRLIKKVSAQEVASFRHQKMKAVEHDGPDEPKPVKLESVKLAENYDLEMGLHLAADTVEIKILQ